jgi:VWFA-related protein
MRIRRAQFVVGFSLVVILPAFSAGMTLSQNNDPVQRKTVPGIIRVEVTFVPVPVLVLDKSGKPVSDLSKDDFIILEDGVRQDIANFSVQHLAPLSGGERKRIEQPTAQPEQPAAPDHRSFLLLLGRGFHARNFGAVKRLIEFVREGLGPTDQVAVMAYGRATNFTTDRDAVVQLLERYEKASLEIEQSLTLKLRGLAAVYGVNQLTPKLQARVDNIFDVPGIASKEAVTAGKTALERQANAVDRETFETEQRAAMQSRGQKADVFVTDSTLRTGTVPIDSRAQSVRSGGSNPVSSTYFDIAELRLITDLSLQEYMALRGNASLDLQNIFSAIAYLRYIEGEKHLLFLTEQGLFLPNLEDDSSIASVASDAGVRIHSLQTGGVYDSGDAVSGRTSASLTPDIHSLAGIDSPSFSRSFALGSLHTISRLSGGLAFTRSDISSALRDIGHATGLVYYLAYRPKNPMFDGKYRRIQAGVRRSGLRVITRGGYYARPLTAPYDWEKFITYARTVAAANHPDLIDDIRVDAETSKKRIGDGKLRVTAEIRIRADEGFFTLEDGLRKARLAVNCFLLKDHEEILAQSWDTLDLNLREETYQRVLREGIPVSASYEVPGKGNRGTLKVIVYDPKTDKLGTKVRRLW